MTFSTVLLANEGLREDLLMAFEGTFMGFRSAIEFSTSMFDGWRIFLLLTRPTTFC